MLAPHCRNGSCRYVWALSLQIDEIDYTDSGDECTNKCQWYNDTKHTSEFIMRCLDYNGTWAQCTPFACKISMFHTLKVHTKLTFQK